MKANTYAVGDRVKWRSQAAGSWLEKLGTVIEVVPAKRTPTTIGHLGTRNHESYVVEATVVLARKAKPQKYWPVAWKLTRVRKAA